LKAQLALVIAERDRLNILLSEKVAECDSLRTRHSKDLEASPSRTRESITRASNVARQDQATEQLKRVYEEAIQNLESRVKLLDSEVTRLIGVLSDRDHELETWRGRSREFATTTQENQRLNQLLADRIREIEDLRREIPSPGLKRGESERASAEAEYKKLLEAQLSEVSARNAEERQRLLQQLQELTSRLEVISADNQRLSVTANQAHQEIEGWKHRYEQLERQREAERHQEIERRAHESPKRAHVHHEGGEEQISEKVDFLNHEIERLQEHLNNTLKELEDWRKRYSELEILRTQELDALRHQFEDSKRFTIEAREVSTKFNAERAAYEAQIGQLQQRVVDAEAQLRLIASENERVLRLSHTRSTEAEESKRKYQELKSSQSIEINQLRAQVEAFKANTTDVKQLAIKYSADKAADQSQIKQLKQVNENYKTEIEKLYELIEQRKADFENLTLQNQDVLSNFERLSEELRQHSTATYSNQEKLEIALREVQDLKASRDEFKNQAERNSTELTRKNKDLIDRIQEVDVLKLRYEESLANYHALNVKLFEKLSH
jgi:DNA repair exonuclease SbcCD ATPase subunit